MLKLQQQKFVRILFDEYHSESWTVSEARAAEIQPDRPAYSSYQQAADALARLPHCGAPGDRARRDIEDRLAAHRAYIRSYGEDMPEIRNWRWTPT